MVAVSVLTEVLISLGAILLVSCAAAFVIVQVLYRRIRRSRALSGAALRTRVRFSRGPQREVLRLRLRLKETLDSGQAAVGLALRSGAPRGELQRLFRRINSEGVTLESQLQLMSSETDSTVLAEDLDLAGRRVDQVCGLVRRLRASVAASLGDLTDDTLTTLGSEVDREVAALKAGVQELRTLNGYDGLSDPRRQLSMDRLHRGNES